MMIKYTITPIIKTRSNPISQNILSAKTMDPISYSIIFILKTVIYTLSMKNS